MAFGRKREEQGSAKTQQTTAEQDLLADQALLDLPDRELMSILPTVGWLGGGLFGGLAAKPFGTPAQESPPIEDTP